MSTPPDDPKHAINPEAIQLWADTATNKRLELLVRAAEPLYLTRADAFTEMAELLKDVIEELRVISAALRQESQEICGHVTDLKAQSRRVTGRSRRPRAC